MKNLNNNYNKKYPKVSIIIPVYNGENYLSYAIKSALRQTYSNLEIIVVNDGSTDKTAKICKKYKNKIKYIEKENGGVSSALNIGIQNMTGEYFSWLSHDDLYYSNKIEKEIEYLINNNLLNTKTIVYSNFSTIDAKGKLISNIEFNTYDVNKFSDFSLLRIAVNGLSLLIPKFAFDDVGLFDTKLSCVQDYKLWFKMIKNNYKFVHIPEILVTTRVHSKTVTNTSAKVKIEGNKFWIELLKSYSINEIKKMYNSEYMYYYSIYNLFNDGPYNEVIDFCKKNYMRIEKENQKIINNSRICVVIYSNKNIENLKETYNSIINQSLKFSYIYVLCSKKFADKNSDYIKNLNVKVILNDDLSECNQIINSVKADYISFVKAGDVLAKDKNKIQITKMISSKLFVSHTSYNCCNNFFDSGYLNGYITQTLLFNSEINYSTLIFDLKFLKKQNISFDNNLKNEKLHSLLIESSKNNYLLGIREPLVTINNYPEKINYELIYSKYIKDIYFKEYKKIFNNYQLNNYNKKDKFRKKELIKYCSFYTKIQLFCKEIKKLISIIIVKIRRK
ncbi:MAG: glycosyltransferase [Bacilli bacterium]|nr:glycosyltransferase [Bacilli bacterium]